MLEYLSVDGMSSEEDSAKEVGGMTVTVFLVKLCVWRVEEVTEYLGLIDKQGRNLAIDGNRGSKACPRISSNITGTTFPTGLPRNMYNPLWLQQMNSRRPDFESEVLRVSEEAFELLRVAAC